MPDLTRPDEIDKIARTVHEALRAWSAANGQTPYPAWSKAQKWMKQSTLESVEFVLANPDAPPSAQHDQWAAQKKRDGWAYGPEKDPAKKTHPMLVAYADLPEFERRKDALLNAVVRALA